MTDAELHALAESIAYNNPVAAWALRLEQRERELRAASLELLQQRDEARAALAALRESFANIQVLGSGAFGDPKWVAYDDVRVRLEQR